MMMKKILIFILGTAFIWNLSISDVCAQFHCGSDFTLSQISEEEREAAKQAWSAYYNSQFKTTSSQYTVPVVVHIIHNGGPENISDAQVIQAIQYLNDSFENTGYYDQGTGVDVDIEFCLATRDPDGMPTSGINRVQDPLTDLTMETQDLALKNLSRWEPYDYINFWVVGGIYSSAWGDIAGYAYFPGAHGGSLDGIVVEASYFGISPASSGVNSHEMGHYLGLHHTFAGGCANNDCTLNGDGICDTPPDNTTASPCSGTLNSCNTDTDSGFTSDQFDLPDNYMDYGNGSCRSAFTNDQKTRMQYFLTGVRASLLSSLGCTEPCYSPLTADFTVPASTIYVQDLVTFTNSSSGSINYEWYVNDVLVSSTSDLTFSFQDAGYYQVTLIAYNADPNCFDEITMSVLVICPVNTQFVVSDYYPLPGDLVTLTNTSSFANNYQWEINGMLVSTLEDFEFSSMDFGFHEICLTSDNVFCAETFCLNLLVTDTPPACDPTFMKKYGNWSVNEEAHEIVVHPDGGYYLSGAYDSESFISFFDEMDNHVWTRFFEPDPGFIEWHQDLILDSDNNLLGTGRGVNVNGTSYDGFVFKYDPVADNLIWAFTIPSADPSYGTEIIETTIGGDYMLSSQFWTSAGLGCDAGMFTIERNTGAIISENFIDVGACEAVIDIEMYNGVLYGSGRYTYAGGGQNKMRSVITKFNADGTEDWTGIYLNNISNDNAREYGRNLLIQNNEMVVCGHGDPDGSSPDDIDLHLYKTDMNGNLIWARYLDITGALNERPWSTLALPDGYVIAGFYESGADLENFVIKTDLDGDIIWAKKFGNSNSRFYDIAYHNFHLYAVGYLEEAQNNDILIVKMTIDGEILSDNCEIEDILVISNLVSNPFEMIDSSPEFLETQNFINLSPSFTDIWLSESVLCQDECVEDCNCPFSVGLPEDLLLCESAQISEIAINLLDTCELGEVSWHHIGNSTFTSLDSIFTLNVTTPGTDTIIVQASNSCYLVFDTMVINTITSSTSILELGPDISICDNGIYVLDAGPGFSSYEWQDGNTDQTYTAAFPGTYEVTVTDSCGNEQTDQLTIDIIPSTIIDLRDTMTCPQQIISLSLSGFDDYQWWPDDGSIDCLTCPTVNINAVEGVYTIQASTANGCVSVDSFYLEINDQCCLDSLLAYEFESVDLTCYGSADGSISLQNFTGSNGPYEFSLDSINWQSDPLFSDLAAGLYNLIIKDVNDCLSFVDFEILSPDPISVNAGEDVSIDILEEFQLMGSTGLPSSEIQNIDWQPASSLSCSDCLDPIADPDMTTSYILTITDINGCANSDTVIVTVETDYEIFIPNSFTPDGNGVNDIFTVYGSEIVDEIVVLRIYNRWGELVFNSKNFPPNDLAYGWDGRYHTKNENSGVFVYLLEAQFIDGKRIQYKGNVTLLR